MAVNTLLASPPSRDRTPLSRARNWTGRLKVRRELPLAQALTHMAFAPRLMHSIRG
jgi:hypothetical protein